MPLNSTPDSISACTTAAEKPHCGKVGVPFMNKTTGAASISALMRFNTGCSVIRCLSLCQSFSLGAGNARGQRQRVQLAAHAALQRLIDELVLLDAAQPREGFRGDV